MTMAASDHRERGKAPIALLAARLAAARLALILLLMGISLAVAVTARWRWFAASRDNATIRKLVAGENVEIDPASASSKVLATRAYYLLKRERIDEAQVVLDQARFRASPSARVDMLYNMAATDIRPYPAGLALALLIVLYGALPIYDRLRAPGYAFPRLARPRTSDFTLKEAQS